MKQPQILKLKNLVLMIFHQKLLVEIHQVHLQHQLYNKLHRVDWVLELLGQCKLLKDYIKVSKLMEKQ